MPTLSIDRPANVATPFIDRIHSGRAAQRAAGIIAKCHCDRSSVACQRIVVGRQHRDNRLRIERAVSNRAADLRPIWPALAAHCRDGQPVDADEFAQLVERTGTGAVVIRVRYGE